MPCFCLALIAMTYDEAAEVEDDAETKVEECGRDGNWPRWLRCGRRARRLLP